MFINILLKLIEEVKNFNEIFINLEKKNATFAALWFRFYGLKGNKVRILNSPAAVSSKTLQNDATEFFREGFVRGASQKTCQM